MAHRLVPIPQQVTCGIAAVCAATGRTVADVALAIRAAAKRDGEKKVPHKLKDSRFRHQAMAIEALRWKLFDPHGRPVAGRSIPKGFMVDPRTLPTISSLVRRNRCPDILLCEAARRRPDGEIEGHTFVTDCNLFFDNNSGGQIRSHLAIDPDIGSFFVIRTLRVR